MGLLFCAHIGSIPVLLWLAGVDQREHRLPDPGTLGLLAWSYLVSGFVLGPDSTRHHHAVVAAACVVAALWLLHELPGHPLGFGDVKLGAALGLQCGWWGIETIPFFLAISFFSGGLIALGLLVTGRLSPRQHIAFGPFLMVGWIFTLVTAADGVTFTLDPQELGR